MSTNIILFIEHSYHYRRSLDSTVHSLFTCSGKPEAAISGGKEVDLIVSAVHKQAWLQKHEEEERTAQGSRDTSLREASLA